LGLGPTEAKAIMAEADVDGNGEISYEEFIPLAVDLVYSMYARLDDDEAQQKVKDAAQADANELLKGMKQEEIEEIMRDIFKKSDADNSGALSVAEFQKCCKEADIGLTRKEVNILMHQCDVDGDGMISYDEFVPLCFEMLREIIVNDMIETNKQDAGELQQFITRVWEEADARKTGRLPLPDLSKALWDAQLGLTRVQLHTICSSAEYEDETGVALVDYTVFAYKAAQLMYRMLDLDARNERDSALREMETDDDSDLVHGYSRDEMEQELIAIFQAADPTNSGSVRLADVRPILVNSTLGLTESEVKAVIASASADELDDGMILYHNIVRYAFYILQYLAQEAKLGR